MERVVDDLGGGREVFFVSSDTFAAMKREIWDMVVLLGKSSFFCW